MRRILSFLILLLAAGMTLISCDFETFSNRSLATKLSVSASEITLEARWAEPVSFEVHASGDWIIICPETLRVVPLYGTGNETVQVSAPDNLDPVTQEPLPPRDFTISVCGTDIVIPVTVHQKGAEESYDQI